MSKEIIKKLFKKFAKKFIKKFFKEFVKRIRQKNRQKVLQNNLSKISSKNSSKKNRKLICFRFQVENESHENAGVMTNQLCLTSEWLALHGALHCGGSVLYYNRSTWLRLTPFNYCLQKPFHNVMQRGT